MTGDDIAKALVALGMVLMGGAITWLVSSVLHAREKIASLEGKMEVLKSDLDKLEKNLVTVECVREVIEAALERRDKNYSLRREEWDKLHKLEIKEAIHTHMETMVPKVVTEIRNQFQLELKPYSIVAKDKQ